MHEISKELLQKLAEDYSKDKTQKVVRHFLQSNDLTKAADVLEASSSLYHNFSIDIETLPVANQRRSGRCWIYAALNVLREEVAKKCKLENFELSQNYMAFYDKLEKINFMMECVIDLKDRKWDDRHLTHILQTGIQDGGQWDMFVALVKKYGVMPQSAMPESFQSGSTQFMNQLLSRYIRKFAHDIRGLSDAEIARLKGDMLSKCYGMLCSCFGVPPKTFDFEYVDKNKKYHLVQDLDPHKFYDDYVGINLDDYVSIINSPTSDKPFYDTFTVAYLGNVYGVPVKYLNLPLDVFKEAIIKQMSNKEVVWFGSDCGKYGERTKGYWDPDSFDFDSLFDMDLSFDKETGLMFRESAMNHAMVLTGVNLVDGKPTKWKIENSWGDKPAKKGYFVCSDTWFDHFVYQVVVHKKYLSDEALAADTKEPHVLDPWDPMVTLAD